MTEPCTPAFDHQTGGPRSNACTPFMLSVFLRHMAQNGVVSRAARESDMSLSSVYSIRESRPQFRFAWDAARLLAREVLFDNLMERSLEGEEFISVKEGDRWRRQRPNYRLGLGFLDRMDARPVTAEGRLFARHFETVLEMIRDDADTEAWRMFVEENASERLLDDLRDLFPFAEESAKNEQPEFDVWEYADNDWRTDLPPPAGFDGEEKGAFGDDDYMRTLTAHEDEINFARIEAERAARDPEKLARGLASWEAFFGAARGDDTPEERDYEIKSMDGLKMGPDDGLTRSREAAKGFNPSSARSARTFPFRPTQR